MRKFLIALALVANPALGQSNPNFQYGQVPTAAQWNSYFSDKQDTLGFTPINQSGDSMQGPLGLIHATGAGGAPTIAAGAGAGTAPTVSLVNPHDLSFGVSVLTGSSPGTSGIVVTVTFAGTYSTPPQCVFSPSNAAAAALAVAASPWAIATTAHWTLNSNGTALAATTTYTWSVSCLA